MKAVVTRVNSASVCIDGALHGQIGRGFLILLGIGPDDTPALCRGFSGAAKPDLAIPLYEQFLAECERLGFPPQHGEFGAYMQVSSENDGPVTLIVDTDDLK